MQDERQSDASTLDDSSSICLDVKVINSEMEEERRLPHSPRSLGNRDAASTFEGIKHSESISHKGVA